MFDMWLNPGASALGNGAFGVGAFFIALLFFAIAIWAFVWKAFALWHAAQNRQRLWFFALLLINTAGLLEIVYLVWFRKNNAGTDKLVIVPDHVESSIRGAMPKRSTSKRDEKNDDLPVAESSPAE